MFTSFMWVTEQPLKSSYVLTTPHICSTRSLTQTTSVLTMKGSLFDLPVSVTVFLSTMGSFCVSCALNKIIVIQLLTCVLIQQFSKTYVMPTLHHGMCYS